MSQLRVRKMQEFIKQEIGQMLLRDLKDTRLGFVTVTEVTVTGDLREATVYVSLFGSDEEKEKSFAALQNATGFIRTELVILRKLHLPWTARLITGITLSAY